MSKVCARLLVGLFAKVNVTPRCQFGFVVKGAIKSLSLNANGPAMSAHLSM